MARRPPREVPRLVRQNGRKPPRPPQALYLTSHESRAVSPVGGDGGDRCRGRAGGGAGARTRDPAAKSPTETAGEGEEDPPSGEGPCGPPRSAVAARFTAGGRPARPGAGGDGRSPGRHLG